MEHPTVVAPLEFRLLGPLEVVVDGARLPLAGERQRALLALLLLHPNEPVSTERVIDELWGGSPPATAYASLRVAVSKLRRLLGTSHRDVLETLAGGYRLRVEPTQLDSQRFEMLLEEARAEHDPDRAVELLEQALGLWHGPALADLQYESFAQSEARRLSELRLAAREERIEAELALGRHESVVSELEALVQENPLRERPRGALMLALYRSGRQADALEAYREGRRILSEELGLEPGEELRCLEQQILTQDPTIGGPGAARRAMPGRRRPRTALLAAGALVLGAAVAGLAVWLTGKSSGSSPTAEAAARWVAVVDATTNRISRFPLSWSPSRLAIDAHTLWLANPDDLTLARFDVDGHRVEQTIGLGLPPWGIATGAGAVWVLSDRTLVRVDPAFGFVKTRTLPMATSTDISVGDPAGLVVGAGSVWVEDGVSTLLRIDPRTRAVLHRFELGTGIDGVAVGAGSVWVTRGSPATLIRIDPRTDAITARIPIAARSGVFAPYPIGLTVGAGAVWVLNGNTGTVTRVDPALNAVTATSDRISLDPTRIAAGAGAVWVADSLDDAVQRIDPTTDRVVLAIPLGGLPVALAARGSRVWASVEAR
jgi:DNA-binding SARP family transcriptional activator/DNA-binding beta-propeller fold protein YncE